MNFEKWIDYGLNLDEELERCYGYRRLDRFYGYCSGHGFGDFYAGMPLKPAHAMNVVWKVVVPNHAPET